MIYLGNLGPAIAGISHLLETQLLLRRPGRIGPAFLGRGLRSRSDVGVLGRSLALARGSGLVGGRRRRRWLALAWRDRSRRGARSGGLGRVGGRAFPLATWLGRRLLLTAGLRIGRLLRNVHGRLDGRRVMLLLSPHIGLGGAVGEFHTLIATGHVGLVGMVAVWARRSAVWPVSRHGIALHESRVLSPTRGEGVARRVASRRATAAALVLSGSDARGDG